MFLSNRPEPVRRRWTQAFTACPTGSGRTLAKTLRLRSHVATGSKKSRQRSDSPARNTWRWKRRLHRAPG